MPDKALHKTIAIVLGLAAVLAVLLLIRQTRIMHINNQITLLEEQIRALQYENEKLEIELSRYTGLQHIDTQAARLQMIRPRKVRFIQKNKLERRL
ncbi:MAG: septum formation initiator family protein [Candidatus Margulisbacteria bacterium]|jgi:cell division protein FtsL|nr:septum formation initiator family protein [Candidatus Margulisiibacteriota bacterium]